MIAEQCCTLANKMFQEEYNVQGGRGKSERNDLCSLKNYDSEIHTVYKTRDVNGLGHAFGGCGHKMVWVSTTRINHFSGADSSSQISNDRIHCVARPPRLRL